MILDVVITSSSMRSAMTNNSGENDCWGLTPHHGLSAHASNEPFSDKRQEAQGVADWWREGKKGGKWKRREERE